MTALRPTRAHLLILTLLAFAVGWLTCWLILRFQHLHARFSTDHVDSGVQKFHSMPTPWIGGVAVAMCVGAGTLLVCLTGWFPETTHTQFLGLIIAAIPAFLGGLTEDLTRKVGPRDRLFLTMISGALGAWLLGAEIKRLDTPGVDMIFAFAPVSLLFTMIAVGGIFNAINIIESLESLNSI